MRFGGWALALVLVTAAACGGGGSAGTPAASAPAANGGPATHGKATFGEPRFKGPMRPMVVSTMAAELRAIDLDLAALPALEDLPPAKLRKVMPTFAKALGARCADCHVEGDFAAPTERKAIARGMWDHIVRGFARVDGAPLYCDSCHQGRTTPLLARQDAKVIARFMDAEFVAKLKRHDGSQNDCDACHGEPFDGHVLRKWASASPAQ